MVSAPSWAGTTRDGSGRREGRIAIGVPYTVSDVEARCPLILEGFETFPPQIAGASTLQAMRLAIRLGGKRLQDSRTQGRRVEYRGEPGQETDLEPLFGALLTE